MSFIGNLLWIVLGGGIILFFIYLIGGVLLCITIIGIPFGIQLIKLSLLALAPFGKEIEIDRAFTGPLHLIMNIIWIVIGGIETAVAHLIFGVLCAITIIGLPFAKQHLKLAGMALTPFGVKVT